MGSIVSKVQYDRVLNYIEAGKQDGARLLSGGKRPSDPLLAKGFYIEPTVFADVTMDMRIGKEEIFGPVLSILKWSDEEKMLAQVNQVEYGLTCSIWTNDLVTAHRAAGAVEAGFVWINEVSKHFLGAPFGGYKQSGVGREEGIEELLSFTREKNSPRQPQATRRRALRRAWKFHTLASARTSRGKRSSTVICRWARPGRGHSGRMPRWSVGFPRCHRDRGSGP
jgi:NAD-dependent aldehyde dehydrogenases